MSSCLSEFLNCNRSLFPGESGQQLLSYIAFVRRFCQKFQIPFEECEQLEGLLPRLFQQVRGYEIKDAAVTFDAAMPWSLVRGNRQLSCVLDQLHHDLFQTNCATPQWLRQQVEALFNLDGTPSDQVVTPPSIRSLIAQLAAQRPAKQIIDLCSGTYMLGLQVWNELGCVPSVSCYGEELDAYLCALSRLFVFLCDVNSFSIKERNAIEIPQQTQDAPPRIYVADFPLVGNRTIPASENDPLFDGRKMNVYTDWALIRSVLNRMNIGDRAFLIVTKGALVRKNERLLREDLVENNLLDGVITLPAGLYPNHTLPMELLVFEKGRHATKEGKVLFADLSSFSDSVLGTRRTQQLSQDGITNICNIYRRYMAVEGYSKIVPVEVIQSTGYSLHPPLYLSVPQLVTRHMRLGEIASVIRGLQLPKGTPVTQQGARYLLNVRDIQDGEIRYDSADQIEMSSPLWERKYRIREDDIILTSKGTALKMAIVPPNPLPAYISGNLTILRVDSHLYDPYILYEYLASEDGREALTLIQTGTTIRVLGSSNLEQLAIPGYSQALATEIGRGLKLAVLQYRQALSEINQAYAFQKDRLLNQLKYREETIG